MEKSIIYQCSYFSLAFSVTQFLWYDFSCSRKLPQEISKPMRPIGTRVLWVLLEIVVKRFETCSQFSDGIWQVRCLEQLPATQWTMQDGLISDRLMWNHQEVHSHDRRRK